MGEKDIEKLLQETIFQSYVGMLDIINTMLEHSNSFEDFKKQVAFTLDNCKGDKQSNGVVLMVINTVQVQVMVLLNSHII